MRVLAQDGGTPNRTDTTIVTVNVNRNNYAPRFDVTNFQQTLLETQALAVPFTRATGADNDSKVQYASMVPLFWLGIIR